VAVAVRGRSGAGKSALLRCFLDGLADRGEAVVLAGRCYEQESVPYKAFDNLIDALSRHLEALPAAEAQGLLPRDLHALTRVFPVLRRVEAVEAAPRRAADVSDPQEVRRRARAALRELLTRLGDRQPLVLAIDDLQWGDADSAALLADLLGPPDPPVLLLLGSYRSEDVGASPSLGAFLALPGQGDAVDWRELAVEPLTPAERHELVRSLLGDEAAAAAFAEAIARQSGGYPFFVHELVRHLQAGATPGERPPGPAGDVTLSEVLWGRILRLPEPARRLLEVVAVAGRPLGQDDACAAAGLAAEGPQALASLRAGRLLRGVGPAEGHQVETYHDRVRETVAAHLAADVRQRHHRRLAEVLLPRPGCDPEVLAVHLLGAGEPAAAAGYYFRAAEQAAFALAFDRAVKLYRRVLELRPAEGEEGRRLHERLADALAGAGHGALAAREYQVAAEGAAPAAWLSRQRRAALLLLSSGHVDDGLQALRAVLAAVGMRLPETPRGAFWSLVWQRVWLRLRGLGFARRAGREVPAAELERLDVCTAAAVGLSMVDTVQGAYFQSRALLLALRAGEPARLVSALAIEGAHESIAGTRGGRRAGRLLGAEGALAE
jgi:predicted ATPase